MYKRQVLDSSVYTFNSAAQELVKKFGVAGDTVPAELNFREMRRRENRDSELVVYGRLPLMISAQCLAKTTRGCDKKSGIYPVSYTHLDVYKRQIDRRSMWPAVQRQKGKL